MSPYRLEPLSAWEEAHWDRLIQPFEGRGLFHGQAWLGYLAESRGLEIRRWAVRAGRVTVGYFCGGFLRKGPFRILGSPLRGWGTNFMGPVVNRDLDQAALLDALDALARDEGLALIELEHPFLEDWALERAGYRAVPDFTYLVPLAPDPAAMWSALRSTCRNRIRKALAEGLTVEEAQDPEVADDYHELYARLPERKGIVPPIPRRHARLLVCHLKGADALFTLRVRDRDGRLVAVGLFPHDDRTLYYWSGASRADALVLQPNELLHWTAMRLAAARGLRAYNMCGYGRFKEKFGGRLAVVKRWHKCYRPSARWARESYEAWLRAGVRARVGWLSLRAVVGDRHATPARPEAGAAVAGRERRGRWRTDPFWPRRRRPSVRVSDLWRAPLHDFPMRDEALYQYLPLVSDMEVLEVGPGSGVTAFRLARHVRHLTLLDVAPANVARLRAAFQDVANVAVVCADVCKPELPELIGRRFHAAYALEVFELLPDPGACLGNLAALLRPGGRLMLLFPNYPPPRSPGMTYFATRGELDRLLEEAGFERWHVWALRLRPWARRLYESLHERPLRAYRRVRRGVAAARPLTYDDSWAFQRHRRLEPFKVLLHAGWLVLGAALRLGGDCFERTLLGEDILNRNLLLTAER